MHYGDAIRIFGTIAVVIGHVADMRFGSPVLDRDWWIVNFWDAFSRWAVPAYIMLSGALLLDPARGQSPSEFYRKRLGRIGVPLVFWTAFFMLFAVYYTGWMTWRVAWRELALGKPYTHLHFIFRIAGLYFFTPMMRVWLKHTTRQMQWVAVITALGLSSGDSFMNGLTHNEPSVFARFVPFVGYYLLGYMLRDARVSPRGLRWCWAGFIATSLIVAVGTAYLVHRFPYYHPDTREHVVQWYPSVNMLLYDFLSPPRIVMAVCVWLIFTTSFHQPWPRTPRGQKVVGWWAATTLGLYLIHPAFREIFYLHGKGPTWPNIWLGTPLVALMVYVVSLIATAILMKIPYVRRITG
jgi:surface polysaccharide O-acyltransferase-like enzyme